VLVLFVSGQSGILPTDDYGTGATLAEAQGTTAGTRISVALSSRITNLDSAQESG
jgi:hypothetical protein